jgi:hypothetical protein
MTDNNHPITPPPELVEQWRTAPEYTTGKEMFTMVSMSTRRLQEVATQAARWGADQELEACCKWLHWQNLATHPDLIPSLCADRRPKPPSLKEQALQALALADGADHPVVATVLTADQHALIRRALETLPN